MFGDPEAHREKAREFALKAQQAKDHHHWRAMTTLARSHVLLEVNARWLASTDSFLDALQNNRPWPAPDVAIAVDAQRIEQTASPPQV